MSPDSVADMWAQSPEGAGYRRHFRQYFRLPGQVHQSRYRWAHRAGGNFILSQSKSYTVTSWDFFCFLARMPLKYKLWLTNERPSAALHTEPGPTLVTPPDQVPLIAQLFSSLIGQGAQTAGEGVWVTNSLWLQRDQGHERGSEEQWPQWPTVHCPARLFSLMGLMWHVKLYTTN